MDIYFNPNSVISSESSTSPLQNDTAQFNLDDLLTDDWSSSSPESIEATHSIQLINSDNDSDSGIGSSSTNSPKMYSENLNDFINDNLTGDNLNCLDFLAFDLNNVQNTNDNNLSNSINQNQINSIISHQQNNQIVNEANQHSIQIFTDGTNTDAYLSNLNNILIENNKEIESNEEDLSIIADTGEEDTEELLNNIESMLKSLQSQNDLEHRIEAQKCLIDSIRHKRTKKVKKEPLENSKLPSSFKKISPKVSQNQSQQNIVLPLNQVLTVPSPDTLKANTQTYIIKDSSNSCDYVQLMNQRPQTIKPQVLNFLKPSNQTQQSIAVLNTLPTVNSMPIIIANPTANNSTLIPNTFIIDSSQKSPNPKRLKVENIKKSLSPTQTVQLVPQPSQPLIITSPNLNILQNQQVDPDILKKQSRMIKNRESACLSRKRKKEYLQTLETSLKEEKDKNEILMKENEELKNKVKCLEAENNLLKQHKTPLQSTQIKLIEKPINLNGNSIKTIKTFPINSTNLSAIKTLNVSQSSSLKRPFVMLAVFFIFGLNIFQFIDLNQTNDNSLQINKHIDKSRLYIDNQAAQLAALESVNPRDGALVDSSMLKQIHSRRLLSDPDYQNDESSEKPRTTGLQNRTKSSNLTRSDRPTNSSENMELVLINGTWHLIDLNICYQKLHANYNQTHVKKINTELNGFYERHLNIFQQKPTQTVNNNRFASSLLKNIRIKNQDSPILRRKEANLNKEYPVSLYDNQYTKHETFTRSVRQKNDTYYFVSFRRDHVMLPALIQNKTQRPKLSFLLPALLTNNLNNSNDKESNRQITFMKIDCEVTDTKLFNIKLEDIPLDYIKILHQDYVINQSAGESNSHGSYKNSF